MKKLTLTASILALSACQTLAPQVVYVDRPVYTPAPVPAPQPAPEVSWAQSTVDKMRDRAYYRGSVWSVVKDEDGDCTIWGNGPKSIIMWSPFAVTDENLAYTAITAIRQRRSSNVVANLTDQTTVEMGETNSNGEWFYHLGYSKADTAKLLNSLIIRGGMSLNFNGDVLNIAPAGSDVISSWEDCSGLPMPVYTEGRSS